MREYASPRTKAMFGSLPAKDQWTKIQGMSFQEFAERCRKATLESGLVIGMRDIDYTV